MDQNRIKKAQKTTWIGFAVNLVLTIGKLIAGVIGNSSAMVADGIHSLSDFATDIVVLIFIRISGKDRDEGHPYGHGKFETLATLIISLALLAVAIGIFISGVQKIRATMEGETLLIPGAIALVAAIVCIITKELLYRYTANVGKQIESPALIANAWHHRSDAFSSIGTMIGIGGAYFLGGKFAVLDPIAAVIVSFFIAKVAIEIGFPNIQELLEVSLPPQIEKEIMDLIRTTPEVHDMHHLQTRKIGSVYAIDVHIKLDRNISFVKSHDVATEIEKRLRNKYGRSTQINVHTEPLPETQA